MMRTIVGTVRFAMRHVWKFLGAMGTPRAEATGAAGRIVNVLILALPTGPAIAVGILVSPWGWAGLFAALLGFAVLAGVRLEREKEKREQVLLSIAAEAELSKHWIQAQPPKKYRKAMNDLARKQSSAENREIFKRTGWFCRADLIRITNTSTTAEARRVRVQVQAVVPRDLPEDALKAFVPEELLAEPMRWSPLPVDLKWWHSGKRICDIPPGGSAYAMVARHYRCAGMDSHEVILHLGRAMHVVAWCEGFAPSAEWVAFPDFFAEIQAQGPFPLMSLVGRRGEWSEGALTPEDDAKREGIAERDIEADV
jgi:hypothetical protein